MPRVVAFVVNDGSLNSNQDVATVLLTPSNDGPVLTSGGGSPTFTEDGPAVAIDPLLTATDPDSTNLQSATVTITNLSDAGQEVLAATTAGTSIVASYTAPILTLTGADTLANYQAVLRSVTYRNGHQNPTLTPRSIAFVASDGTANSNTATKVLSVVAVNDASVLTAGGGSPTFTEDGPAVAVDPGISVTDVDDTSLESATVTITNLLDAGAEVLAVHGGDRDHRELRRPHADPHGHGHPRQLPGRPPDRDVPEQLQNPGTTPRTIAFRVNDGIDNSNVVNTTVTVVAVNDAPALAPGGGSPVVHGERARDSDRPAHHRDRSRQHEPPVRDRDDHEPPGHGPGDARGHHDGDVDPRQLRGAHPDPHRPGQRRELPGGSPERDLLERLGHPEHDARGRSRS